MEEVQREAEKGLGLSTVGRSTGGSEARRA
jgi:hypothetical protein